MSPSKGDEGDVLHGEERPKRRGFREDGPGQVIRETLDIWYPTNFIKFPTLVGFSQAADIDLQAALGCTPILRNGVEECAGVRVGFESDLTSYYLGQNVSDYEDIVIA